MKNKSENLSHSEDLLRGLIEAVDEYAIFALDTEGYILTWNLGAQKLKGYKPEDIIGKHFSIFYTTEDIERRHPQYELDIAIRRGKYEEEGWRIRKDGSRFWANVTITAVKDENGNLRGFGKVTRDLSDRKHTEEALRQSQERYRLLIESVQDYAIFMLDPRGHVTTWNKGAERNQGYAAEEILGKHFSIFYSPEDVQAGRPDREIQEAMKYGRAEDEGWRVRKDGSKFWANVVLTAVYDAHDKLVGFSKVTRNLTERKIAEDALKNAYAQLETRIEERTRELSKAKDRLEEAVKARDQFFSMASHELKTPLSSLKLQTQIRCRNVARGNFSDFAPDKLLDLCRDDEKQIDRLAALVERMLDISRISSGSIDLELEKFDLCELAADAANQMKPILEQSGNQLKMSCDKKVIGMWDRLRLSQIVTNLLANAAKYAPGKDVEIRVFEKGGDARLEVIDNGNGIATTELNRIFEPFERVTDQTTATGMGLGLYISKRIAEAHGGSIRAESAPGKGTTFVLDLPATGSPV